jgi:hypothetical protein
MNDHADTIRKALAYLAGYGPDAQRKAGPADIALDALVARLRGVELRNRLLENERNALAARCDALGNALQEIHEYHCGCDRPGNPAACVAVPVEEFLVLAVQPEEEGHDD